MVLSINAANANNHGNIGIENESPRPVLSPSKRKSELISPSSRRRGPLSDVNISEKEATASARAAAAPATTSTPSSTKKPPTPARSYGSSSAPKFNNNIFKHPTLRSCPSKDEIEATDEKQASVHELADWLALESAKKKKKNKPPLTSAPHGAPPISFLAKPRIKKADVEATDSKRVSVKTLSSWMSDDPFEQRKVRTIRSSHRIIAKSRVFEKNETNSGARVAAENDIKVGSVNERRDWLSKEAFKHDGGEEIVMPQTLREKKLRPYQCKPVKETPEKELKSVRDKKEWLSNAFKKGSEQQQVVHHGIQETKSFEVHQQQQIVHPTKSFETSAAATPGIVKSASADNCSDCSGNKEIRQAKSYDGAAEKKGMPQPLDRQPSVVRLYRRDSSKEEEENEKKETSNNSQEEEEDEYKTPSPKMSVHDRQAWLSSAFKKKDAEQQKVNSTAKTPAEGTKEENKKTLVQQQPQVATTTAAMPATVEKSSVKAKSVGTSEADANEKGKNSENDVKLENMSVADRAKWLKGAFKGK